MSVFVFSKMFTVLDFAINFTTHRKYGSFMGRYIKSETEIIDKKYGSIIEIELSYKGGN